MRARAVDQCQQYLKFKTNSWFQIRLPRLLTVFFVLFLFSITNMFLPTLVSLGFLKDVNGADAPTLLIVSYDPPFISLDRLCNIVAIYLRYNLS